MGVLPFKIHLTLSKCSVLVRSHSHTLEVGTVVSFHDIGRIVFCCDEAVREELKRYEDSPQPNRDTRIINRGSGSTGVLLKLSHHKDATSGHGE